MASSMAASALAAPPAGVGTPLLRGANAVASRRGHLSPASWRDRAPRVRLGRCPPARASLQRFEEWYDSHGAAGDAQRRGVTPALLPGFGNSLVASRAVARGEPLLQVPQELILDAERVMQVSALGPQLRAAELSEQCVLAAFLAEIRAAQDAPGEVPYAGILPCSTGSVLEWSAPERAALLAGTSIADSAEELAAQVEAACALVCEAVPDAPTEHLPWAFSVLFSRLVRLEGLGDALALVPFADLLNHTPDCGAFIDFDAMLGAAVLRPDRDYRAGDQVFASYGEKSSAELLLTYGFVPAAGTNPYDTVKVTVALDAADPLYEAKAAAMATYGLAPQLQVPVRMEGMPTTLLPVAERGQVGGRALLCRRAAVLRAQGIAFAALEGCSADEVEAAAAEAFGDAGARRGRGMAAVGTRLGGLAGEVAAREWLYAEMKRLQECYPGTMEEDKALAKGEVAAAEGGAAASPPSRTKKGKKRARGGSRGAAAPVARPKRAAAAATVRLRERQILARNQSEAYAALKARRQQLENGGAEAGKEGAGLGGWARSLFGGGR